MKTYLKGIKDGVVPVDFWLHQFAGTNAESKTEIRNILNQQIEGLTPKPTLLIKRILQMSCNYEDMVLDFFAGSGTTGHAVISLNRTDGGKRKYLLVDSGSYFDAVLKPRLTKVIYSDKWKNGKPIDRLERFSHCFKYIRLESYEDCLNNLEFKKDENLAKTIAKSKELREAYMLHYMLETETRGSQSLLNIDCFVDPTAYQLKVKKPGTDEYEFRNVDLIETFNYLIGLRVEHMDAPQAFTAEFYREPDPELPDDKHTRLKMADRKKTPDGPWWFRKIEGWVPGDNGKNEKILVVWRKLTEDLEKDNLMLDEWFKTIRINPRDFEYDTIYVNGSNNLPNLRLEGESWKVRLIEEDFMQRMWDVEDV
jgi:adenine-specific DNA-methyltransferase